MIGFRSVAFIHIRIFLTLELSTSRVLNDQHRPFPIVTKITPQNVTNVTVCILALG